MSRPLLRSSAGYFLVNKHFTILNKHFTIEQALHNKHQRISVTDRISVLLIKYSDDLIAFTMAPVYKVKRRASYCVGKKNIGWIREHRWKHTNTGLPANTFF